VKFLFKATRTANYGWSIKEYYLIIRYGISFILAANTCNRVVALEIRVTHSV